MIERDIIEAEQVKPINHLKRTLVDPGMEDKGPSASTFRLLYVVVLVQFVVIAILWGWISTEYSNNVWMRLWVSSNAPFLGLFLDGSLGAILVGLSGGWTALFLWRGISPIVRKAKVEKSTLRRVKNALLEEDQES